MPRPSRHLEALQILQDYYLETGVLPTIEVLAQKMGYRSTSSAHNVIQPLLKDMFITQEAHGGRLLPGPGFPFDKTLRTFPELGGIGIGDFLDTADSDAALVEITNNSLQGEGILKGDFLLTSKSAEPQPGDLLLIQNKHSFRLASYEDASPRRRQSGVVLAQFRKYRP